jgi:hypothetical protein
MKTLYHSSFMIAALFNIATAQALKAQLAQPPAAAPSTTNDTTNAGPSTSGGATGTTAPSTTTPSATTTTPSGSGASDPMLTSPGFQDAILSKSIRQNLSQDLSLSGFTDSISVLTSSGQVTLSGVVLSDAERSRVEDIVRSTSGVTGVTNNLTVQTR